MCDRVAIIARGEVVAAGSPDELSRAGGVEVDDRARRAAASRRPRARTCRGSCASWSRRARTSTRSASCAPRSRTPTSRWSAGDDGRADHRRLRAARVAAPARVRRRRAADRRLPRALRPRRRGRSPRRPDEIGNGSSGVDGEIVAGATLLGLSMFATLFLGAILAVFLTLGAVRGDAERGLLQPLLVRPLSRGTFLLGRFVAAGERVRGLRDRSSSSPAAVITHVFIDWWPDRVARARRSSWASAVAIIAALALGGSRRALEHRQRHRDLHALRRRADRRPAGPDRRGAELQRHARRRRPHRRRGCCRSRRSTSRR